MQKRWKVVIQAVHNRQTRQCPWQTPDSAVHMAVHMHTLMRQYTCITDMAVHMAVRMHTLTRQYTWQ